MRGSVTTKMSKKNLCPGLRSQTGGLNQPNHQNEDKIIGAPNYSRIDILPKFWKREFVSDTSSNFSAKRGSPPAFFEQCIMQLAAGPRSRSDQATALQHPAPQLP